MDGLQVETPSAHQHNNISTAGCVTYTTKRANHSIIYCTMYASVKLYLAIQLRFSFKLNYIKQ